MRPRRTFVVAAALALVAGSTIALDRRFGGAARAR